MSKSDDFISFISINSQSVLLDDRMQFWQPAELSSTASETSFCPKNGNFYIHLVEFFVLKPFLYTCTANFTTIAETFRLKSGYCFIDVFDRSTRGFLGTGRILFWHPCCEWKLFAQNLENFLWKSCKHFQFKFFRYFSKQSSQDL